MEVKTDTGRWCPETWKALERHLRCSHGGPGRQEGIVEYATRRLLVGVTLLYITALPIYRSLIQQKFLHLTSLQGGSKSFSISEEFADFGQTGSQTDFGRSDLSS